MSASFWGRTWTACSRGQQTGTRHLEHENTHLEIRTILQAENVGTEIMYINTSFIYTDNLKLIQNRTT